MTGTRDAVADAFELLDSDPAQAKRQAHEILKATPGHPGAQLLLGMAASAEGDHLNAAAILARLTAMQPRFAMAWLALGVAYKGAGQPGAAINALSKAIALQPSLPCAWLTLAEVRLASGDDIGADAAYLQHLHQSHRDPELMRCLGLLTKHRLQKAA